MNEIILKNILTRLEICQKGQCWKCAYSIRNKQCTDSLIDDCAKDVYELLLMEEGKANDFNLS